MTPHGFLWYVIDGTNNLVASDGSLFASTGLLIFHSVAAILLVWESYKIIFRMQSLNRLATLFVSLTMVNMALHYYSTPFPGIGLSLTQVITGSGTYFANQMDNHTAENVGTKLSEVIGGMNGSTWSMLTDYTNATRYFTITIGLIVAQGVMLAVTSFGMVMVGVCVLIGPILIPMSLVPKLEYLASGWFRALIMFSFYPVIGQAFISVYGAIWLNYFSQFSGGMDSTQIASALVQMICLILAGVYGILKIPYAVTSIFNGGGALTSFPGMGWWRT